MKFKRLSATIQIFVAILVITTSLAISQIVTYRYNLILYNNTTEKANSIAKKLALDISEMLLANDLVIVQREIDAQLLVTPMIAYIFVEQNGRVLAHTFEKGVPTDLIGINRPNTNFVGRLENVESKTGERYMDIAWPIFGGRTGTLRLGISESVIRKPIRQLWIQMSLITLLVLVVAILVVYFTIRFLLAPLISLSKSVESIDESNLDTRLKVEGHNEISQLSKAFNHMLGRIKEYTLNLTESNQHLLDKQYELSLSQDRLSSSLKISREIAALYTLQDIGMYLISTFRNLLTCQNMVLMILCRDEELFIVGENKMEKSGRAAYEHAAGALNKLNSKRFTDTGHFRDIPLPEDIQSAEKISVFPFLDGDEHLGALLVGCHGNCRCRENEIDIINPILVQSTDVLRRAIRQEMEIRDLKSRIESAKEFSGLIGDDPKMHLLFKLIEDVAPTDATVLIQGESGTGKEMVAQSLHNRSPRAQNPFVVINCAAYPSTLLESELFGHEKGAFTGAQRKKSGRFELADGGTVFLDEIGEISRSAQIKLLRVLQTRKFERLGGEQEVSVDVRIVAATNKELLQEVKKGNFREDLFYRLNVVPIDVPPLRERKNDILKLSKFFLRRFAEEQDKEVREFVPESMQRLFEYDWPGNVRELENAIEYAVVMAKGSHVQASDIPALINHAKSTNDKSPADTVPDYESQLIKKMLDEVDWNKKKAATRLGMSRSTLYTKLKKYEIKK